MSILRCSHKIVCQTLEYLREAVQETSECIVLWLGHRTVDTIEVIEAFRPQQYARHNRFIIPPEAMISLKAHLREHRLMIAAQVHSHPQEAFHSEADDHGAIVRHVGALSFVVPWFASGSTEQSFLEDAALYELQDGDFWQEIPTNMVETKCLILF